MYDEIGCEPCRVDQLGRLSSAASSVELTPPLISHLYSLGLVAQSDASLSALEQACANGSVDAMDSLIATLWQPELTPPNQTMIVKELVMTASNHGAPDALYLHYLMWLHSAEADEKVKDSRDATERLSKAALAGSPVAMGIMARYLWDERRDDRQSMRLAAFLARHARDQGGISASWNMQRIYRSQAMDWMHWSMRIDNLAFAAITGNSRELSVLARRLDIIEDAWLESHQESKN